LVEPFQESVPLAIGEHVQFAQLCAQGIRCSNGSGRATRHLERERPAQPPGRAVIS
jgi:hypothetical protein